MVINPVSVLVTKSAGGLSRNNSGHSGDNSTGPVVFVVEDSQAVTWVAFSSLAMTACEVRFQLIIRFWRH